MQNTQVSGRKVTTEMGRAEAGLCLNALGGAGGPGLRWGYTQAGSERQRHGILSLQLCPISQEFWAKTSTAVTLPASLGPRGLLTVQIRPLERGLSVQTSRTHPVLDMALGI